MLPQLLERAGPRTQGTVTGFYSVLVEGDDMNDPIADAARSILDGHIVLDRRLALETRYPAIDPLASLSRLAEKISSIEHSASAAAVRSALAAAEEVRDLVEVGAYVSGTNPRADRGLAASPGLIEFFRQKPADLTPATESIPALTQLCSNLGLLA
jgi:flagellar biosynthesis/type III secretory pathway ATPase